MTPRRKHPGGRPSLFVDLNGRTTWVVSAGDEASVPVVEGLAAVTRSTRQRSDRPSDGGDGPTAGVGTPRELRVVVDLDAPRRDRDDLTERGPVEYSIPAPDSPSMRTIAMMRVADVLARDAQRRGAVLVHGTLAELHGGGVVLAGTSQVGKSTAARRLPPPWRALSDDTTLVAPDGCGGFRAHPWPTWSRFFDGEAEVGAENAEWDVQASVPLAAVLVLSQAAKDRVKPVAHPAQATALLIDCVEAVSRGMTRDLTRAAARSVHLEQVANVEAIVAAVPVFHLDLSLTGEFWRLLERVLGEVTQKDARGAGAEESGAEESGAAEPGGEWTDADFDTESTFVYTGPSMNPTLAEPQLLETQDVSGRPLHVGDVVCFRSPRDGITVVHRVVEVGPDGIRTRGDRNPSVDPWVLRPEDILAKVVKTRRGETTDGVADGRVGLLVARSGRLRLALGRLARRALRSPYRGLVASRIPARLWARTAPASAGQRIVRFGTGPLAEYRLYLGQRPIGHYDRRQRGWVVDHPYRLIVDGAALPEPPSTGLSPRDRLGAGERQGAGDGATSERAARRIPQSARRAP